MKMFCWMLSVVVAMATSAMAVDPLAGLRSRLLDPNQNYVLADAYSRLIVSADINTDGVLDEHDAEAWRDQSVPEVFDDLGRISGYAYIPLLDVNGDAKVNTLDFQLAKIEIARALALSGRTFEYEGALVGPDLVVVGFDGVVVTSVVLNPLRSTPGGSAPIAVGPNPRDRDGAVQAEPVRNPCPGGEVIRDVQFPVLQSLSNSWDEWRNPCGTGIVYACQVSVQEQQHNYRTKQLGCGVAGPQTYTLSTSRTSKTTMSVNAGLGCEKLGLTFGVEWGSENEVTVTETDELVLASEEYLDDTYGIRFLKYKVVYKAVPTADGGCLLFTPQDNDVGTILTSSSQTKRKTVTCPGCPGPNDG